LHTYVTTCTNHSEYAALFLASKEAYHLIEWLRPLQPFLKLRLEPTKVFLDNDGARALSNDPVSRAKNKHIMMSHHYTQELVAAGVIETMGIDTNDNYADALTKPLGPNTFPTHAKRFVRNTVPQSSVIPQSSARVMMFCGSDRLVLPPPAQAEVGTQCDYQRDVPDAAQLEEVRVAIRVTQMEVVGAAVEFKEQFEAVSKNLAERQQLMADDTRAQFEEVTRALAGQQQLMADATRAQHTRLSDIVERIIKRNPTDERSQEYEPGSPEVYEVPAIANVNAPPLEVSPVPHPLPERPINVPRVQSPEPYYSPLMPYIGVALVEEELKIAFSTISESARNELRAAAPNVFAAFGPPPVIHCAFCGKDGHAYSEDCRRDVEQRIRNAPFTRSRANRGDDARYLKKRK
jgi:polyhydroxyalkanoate synthesis regulator phasin